MFCTVTIGSREIFSITGLANYIIYTSSTWAFLAPLLHVAIHAQGVKTVNVT